MNKLFLLDAYALIYRAYYAFIKNPRINSKGQNTSAILGFVLTLEEVIIKEQPTHIAVCFDPSGPTFRHEAYPQYKAQRPASPEAIQFAVPYIKRLLAAHRIPVLEVPGYEADDVIGTIATKMGSDDTHVYMMTPDKDYAQLVTPHITMYRPSSGRKETEKLGPEEVKAKYALSSPTQVIDMLALMGDASDNIPGCPGVGEKTAQKLIAQYGSVENLLAHTTELKGALQQKVEQNSEQIRFSKWLATIKRDVPIDVSLQALERRNPDSEQLTSIYQELEFRMFVTQIKNQAPTTEAEKSGVGESPAAAPAATKKQKPAVEDNGQTLLNFSNLRTISDLRPNYQLCDTPEQQEELARLLQQQAEVAIALQVSGGSAITAQVHAVGIAISPGKAWSIPLTESTLPFLRSILESDTLAKVGHDLKPSLNALHHSGIQLRGRLFDTMLAHYLVSPELSHTIHYLAQIYLNYELIPASSAELKDPLCESADIALQLAHKLRPELKQKGVEDLFWNIEMPLMPVLARMEQNGVCIDSDSLMAVSRNFSQQERQLENEIHQLAGTDFNIASARQVGEILFDRLQLSTKARKTRKGQYVTDEETLESLRGKHPIVEKILQYRALRKLLGTYVDALPQLVNPATHRIHTSFNQAVAQTGRLSSSNPNLQNIPVREQQGREVRKAFIPAPGEIFFSADYSQIELRIMAHLSGDPNLIGDFLLGHDIHAATASKIFHKPIAEVTPQERRSAKTANFGIIYGISAFGLAERLGCSRSEAKQLIDNYFLTYPAVRQYMDRSIQMARDRGFTQTLFQRRLSLPDINSRNAIVRGYAERNAINAPIQGSAADIIKIAMIRIHQRMQGEGVRSTMILQVHDELCFSVPPEERQLMQQLVIEEMQGAAQLQVPLIADCGWGANWLEAH